MVYHHGAYHIWVDTSGRWWPMMNQWLQALDLGKSNSSHSGMSTAYSTRIFCGLVESWYKLEWGKGFITCRLFTGEYLPVTWILTLRAKFQFTSRISRKYDDMSWLGSSWQLWEIHNSRWSYHQGEKNNEKGYCTSKK